MRKVKVVQFIGLISVLVMLCIGCSRQTHSAQNTGEPQIYFFDQMRNELVAEPLGEGFKKQESPQEKVEYIINRLVENKSTQLVTLQNTVAIPYLRTNMADDLTDDPTVKFHFTRDYYDLTPAQKLGMRASIVYSLTALDFIQGIDFYVEDKPLITSTGEAVGTIYPGRIKTDVLDPNPATKPYTLSLYFANAEGKLEKEEQSSLVSDSALLEKLIIEKLIEGPSVEGLSSTLPHDVKVNEVEVTNGVCQVDLSFDPKSKFFTSEEKKELMIYSIVNSLTELPQIKKVVIFLEGQRGIEFTDEIDFGDFLERRESYINQKSKP